MIVSNPPYIDENDTHLLFGDVRFEPKTALVTKRNGIADLEEIILTSKHFLKSGGKLFLEHGWQQHLLINTFMQSQNYINVQSKQDHHDKTRITYGEHT